MFSCGRSVNRAAIKLSYSRTSLRVTNRGPVDRRSLSVFHPQQLASTVTVQVYKTVSVVSDCRPTRRCLVDVLALPVSGHR